MLPISIRSADLCSGLGCWAFALQGFAKPVLYCENDPLVSSLLLSSMNRGLIPEAKIHADLKDLVIAPGSVEMVSCSWPCQGNSLAGKRKGLEDERSGLIHRVLEIVNEAQPLIVILENVPEALKTSLRLILDATPSYDAAWGNVSASQVGLPQKRARFFCLLVRRKPSARCTLTRCLAASEAHTIRQQPEPKRMLPKQNRANAQRSASIGNSVVPACAKAAFELLARSILGTALQTAPILRKDDLRPWGRRLNGKEVHVIPPVLPEMQGTLTFDPAAYKPPTGFKARSTHKPDEVLAFPQRLHVWPTPRHSNIGGCHFLTSRAMRDLGTAVRFEVSTPDEDRSGVPSADWIEWLMGIPIGYTNEFCNSCENTYVKNEEPAAAGNEAGAEST